MSTVDFSGAVWRKSTRSTAATNANCVEVAHAGVIVGVRDSKNPTATPLTFPAAHWARFLRSTRA
ncbi:DUF397 domain-containing protein [Saccharothrix variisporea]|uniref:Uncharacterized protein DUF397 n=1 Tax=Saccharothrix variisporea TaxID=543527 RepID=A0A495XIK8_9PSEU|nr:DUF397 domain-containing protein [Saccharothrix variisporea]RKT71438.1 uncharacterized protein DUF397 [Saccharothrix variisporea]